MLETTEGKQKLTKENKIAIIKPSCIRDPRDQLKHIELYSYQITQFKTKADVLEQAR